MAPRTQIDRSLVELNRLHDGLDSVVVCPDHTDLAETARSLQGIIDRYLIPRQEDPTTPLTVVFAGPTGSGKSTLINSLTRLDLSTAGVLRPTTTRPVVLCHPDRVDHYRDLDGLETEVVIGDAPALATMTFVDTPDIDSTAREHRLIAEHLIDSADIIVFVTSALRYADDVPWQVLRRARSRGAEVVHVLNRVASARSGALIDFRSRLRSEAMDDDVVVVPEYHLGPDRQMLPSVAIKGLAKRLTNISSDREDAASEIRSRVRKTTFEQARELAIAAEAAAVGHEEADEDLVSRLRAASTDVGMPEVVEGIVSPIASDSPGPDVRRWVKAVRSDVEEIAETERRILERSCSELLARVRSTALHESESSAIDPAAIVDGVEEVIETAVSGWVHFVKRMTEPLRRKDQWPGQLALLGATLGVDTSGAIAKLFEDEADEVIGRARRELVGRAEVVYTHLAERIVELSFPRLTIDRVLELRAGIPQSAYFGSGVDA